MPVVIGMMQKTFGNPVGLLSDCHRRIESFLSMLLAVASHADGALDMELPNALETALKYFREAAPMHTADEEESLFPLLRLLGRPDISGGCSNWSGWKAITRPRSRGIVRSRKSANAGFGKSRFAYRREHPVRFPPCAMGDVECMGGIYEPTNSRGLGPLPACKLETRLVLGGVGRSSHERNQ
jgi:hypothetical protein